jgi:glyoxylase-like metal-dependent hydrolase (beta-lactamase superfamily II)
VHPWKGRKDSKVKRWDVITIGNLSRNRYWGESDAKGVRAALCTCTLIVGDDFRLLVDPSLANAADMAKELDRRTGVKPGDIDALFVTHEHGDHVAGMAHFPDARWLAAPAVAEALNKSRKLSRRFENAPDRLFDAVEVIATSGHTHSHHSLRFDCEGLSIVVAGDAVATRDFFRARRGYFNAVDFEQSARTMDRLAALADILVPGHDNYFLVDSVTGATR